MNEQVAVVLGVPVACRIAVKTELKFYVSGFMVRFILVPFVSVAVMAGSCQRCTPAFNLGAGQSRLIRPSAAERAFKVLILCVTEHAHFGGVLYVLADRVCVPV